MPTIPVLLLGLAALTDLPPACVVDGVAFEAVAEHAEPGVARYRWAKHAERSITLTLVERDGLVAGAALLPSGERRQALGRADAPIEWMPIPEDGSRSCAGSVDGTALAGAKPQNGSLAGGCPDGDRVDVLILTTPAARTQAAGQRWMTSRGSIEVSNCD